MIPLARLIRCRDFVAAVIAGGETAALPIFERLEAEIAAVERAEASIARARTIAAAGLFNRRAADAA